MQQRGLQKVLVSVFLIFLIHGLIIATWTSRISAFQAHLHLSSAVLGRSLMMAAVGSVLAMPAAGWLINKFGSLRTVLDSAVKGSARPNPNVDPIMSSFHALFSLAGMAGSALGGLVASRAVPAGIHFWVRYSTCRNVHNRIQVASASLST
jgi:hypothetical protein